MSEIGKQDWPFDQARDVATLTTRQVAKENLPILNVVHYSDDHSWAFTCGTTNDTDDGLVVHMGHMIDLDPSLLEIADLPPGWVAVRALPSDSWERYYDEEM